MIPLIATARTAQTAASHDKRSANTEFLKLRLRHVALPLSLFVAASVTGCVSLPLETQSQTTAEAVQVIPTKIAQDRDAILSMTGNYEVTFDFTETVALKDGYELKEPKLSEAHEVVRVIRDEPGYISLQHILVVGKEKKHPVKHWRQDWVYEPEYVLDFIGFNSWEKRALSPTERKGKWAQFVYQVDDSPRYSSVAEWQHENGISAWTSPPNMRPLPRRDMTTRDDYHGVLAINRHAITPGGWVHEQDNTKLILTGDSPQALVREVGVNTYSKSDNFEIEIADNYWDGTQDYWAGIRDIWTQIEADHTAFGLTIQGEPTGLYMPVMGMANQVKDEELSVENAVSQAADIIDTHTTQDVQTSVAQAKKESLELSDKVQ